MRALLCSKGTGLWADVPPPSSRASKRDRGAGIVGQIGEIVQLLSPPSHNLERPAGSDRAAARTRRMVSQDGRCSSCGLFTWGVASLGRVRSLVPAAAATITAALSRFGPVLLLLLLCKTHLQLVGSRVERACPLTCRCSFRCDLHGHVRIRRMTCKTSHARVCIERLSGGTGPRRTLIMARRHPKGLGTVQLTRAQRALRFLLSS